MDGHDFAALAVYVLAFNAFLACWAVYLRAKIWLRSQKGFDIQEFLAGLPRGTRLVDPWILVDGRWIKTGHTSYTPSPH
jgi:hypothetical protein